jgi:two-component system response regulator AtoC
VTSLQILVVDDEPAIRQILAASLGRAGHTVELAGGGQEALGRLAKGDIDLVLCDINMPDLSGIEVVRQARAASIDATFIMITAYSSLDTAIEAMKAGAFDYMIKPLRTEEIVQRLVQVADLRGLRAENRILRSLVASSDEEAFQPVSPAMRAVERLVSKVAPTDSTVLVTGESGTGKGVVAKLIHQRSERAAGPFIPVNCGAIPENLIESEFFGHLKGAFTGADRARKGLFVEADRGTLFLDEIGELPLALQVKLLHVLESKEVRPVGGEQVRRTNARIVAATNRDLRERVAEGKFREDLYFRLSAFQIEVPPLRARREDVGGLLDFLLARTGKRLGIRRKLSLDPEALEALLAYDWPGNVREVENVLGRAAILAEDGRISLAELPAGITPVAALPGADAPTALAGCLRDQVRRFEQSVIHRAIAEAGGDRRAAARNLGIGLSSLYRKLEDADAEPEAERNGGPDPGALAGASS